MPTHHTHLPPTNPHIHTHSFPHPTPPPPPNAQTIHPKSGYAYAGLDIARQALSLVAALAPLVLVAMRDGREGVTVRRATEYGVCVWL